MQRMCWCWLCLRYHTLCDICCVTQWPEKEKGGYQRGILVHGERGIRKGIHQHKWDPEVHLPTALLLRHCCAACV